MNQIVIDARELRTTTGRYVERLLHYLQEVDTDMSHRYVVLLKPKDMEGWNPSSKRFTKVACKYKEFSFAEQTGLLWKLIRLHPDLVHFPMVQQPILYPGRIVTTFQDLTTLRFANPTKNKYVFRFKQWVYRWVNVIASRKSKGIITPSEYVKDDVARTLSINSRRITVTYEAGDSIDAKPEPMEEFEGKEFIMYVGRPQPHKNLERLIEAFAVLKQTRPDLHLVLAGKKDTLYRRHERDTKRKGIPDVHFTDFVSDGELRWLYEHCAAYVFPSLSEGFGLPALEAMAHGAPVVSSNATCLPEIYGDAAHYFDPTEVEEMAKAIGDVLKKPELRKKLIKAGKARVKTFSWRRMAEQTLDVYRQALGEK
ncbi:MAG TPA: glycosyltransferase family 1 protein [Candidatus Saccharimonadales bacterium]|nr:glycosyltransferase family 1 protein [Candidatus Saccharimonadales bacterium]